MYNLHPKLMTADTATCALRLLLERQDLPYGIAARRKLPGDVFSYTFDEDIIPVETFRLRVQYLIKDVGGNFTHVEDTICKLKRIYHTCLFQQIIVKIIFDL